MLELTFHNDAYLKYRVDALEDVLGSERRWLCMQKPVVEQSKVVFPVLVPGQDSIQVRTLHTAFLVMVNEKMTNN